MCECGIDREDSIHVIKFCPLYEDIRRELGARRRMTVSAIDMKDLIRDKRDFWEFHRFAREVFRRRREMQ